MDNCITLIKGIILYGCAEAGTVRTACSFGVTITRTGSSMKLIQEGMSISMPKLFTGWEENQLRQLGITTRNPFEVIRLLLLIITELRRGSNGK